MRVKDMLAGIDIISGSVDFDMDIQGITIDSRKVKEQDAFLCFAGTKFDGHLYIEDAVKNGAKLIVVQKDIEEKFNVPVIKIPEGRENIAKIACNFYKNPSKEFKLIGVTGTKGKTTSTYMIKSILEAMGLNVGIIGTIECKIGDEKLKTSENTTPDAVELQKLFRVMADKKADAVVMEVSSHALDLDRVYGSDFDIALFTNLSQDHMDYHKNFENYFLAKKKLFAMTKLAYVNIDDEYGKRMYKEISCPKKSVAIEKQADIVASDIEITSKNVSFNVESENEIHNMHVKIPGKFSVYNALIAIASAKELGATYENLQKGFDNLVVPGRSEVVKIDRDFTVMVDYAHSPDSLKNILTATKEYAKGRIISVFGCGGDRDRTKRPIMGRISGELADFTIITSDNPRSENPEEIIKEVESGIKEITTNYMVVSDRAMAIREALKIASKDDVVVIAGKGHEPYQILKDKTIHFDDREQVVIQNEMVKSIREED